MKRYLFILIMLITSVTLIAVTKTQINFGIDWFGTHSIDSFDFDSGPGISPSFEVMSQKSEGALIGIGLEYQIGRGFIDSGFDDARYGFVPIYLVGKIPLGESETIRPEFILNGGFDFMTGNTAYSGGVDLNGGLYGAIGLGINYHTGFNLQLMYRSFSGGASAYGDHVSITQHNPSLIIGWRF
jgi:hypothetical protein